MLLASLVALALVAGTVVARTLHEGNEPGVLVGGGFGMQDFRDAIYYPIRSLLDGHNPYDVPRHRAQYPVVGEFLYAPHMLAVHLPFGLLDHATAQRLHLALNVLAVIALAAVALRAAGRRASALAVALVATALLASRPGHMALFLGQTTPYLVIGTYLALAASRAQPWLGAAGVAIACIKPTFGGPLVLLLLARGDVRRVVLGGAIAGVLALPVVVRLVANVGGLGPFLASLGGTYESFGHNPTTSVVQTIHRVDLFVLFGRLFGRAPGTLEGALVTLVVLGAAAVIVRRLALPDDAGSRRLSMVVICVTTLAVTYHQTYDALVLAVPALVALHDDELPRGVRTALGAAIAVPAVNYLSSYGAMRRLALSDEAVLAVGSLNAIAVAVCLLVVLGLGWRRTRNPDSVPVRAAAPAT